MRALIGLIACTTLAALACTQNRPAWLHAVPEIEPDFQEGLDWGSLGKHEGTASVEDRMDFYKVPGIGIAVIDDWAVIWTGGFGVLEAGTDAEVTKSTRFEAGSTTKMVTAMAALHLLAQGRITLDEDVNERLVSWKVPDTEFTRKEKVTIRRILSHTAGINRPPGGFSHVEGESPTLVQVLSGASPATNKALALEFVPGSDHEYSNMGYLVLQQLLMDVAEEPFPELMRKTLFDPLRMEASGFEYELPPDIAPRPHGGDGTAHPPALHPSALAQGGLRTTPPDLARLVIEIMKSYQGTSNTVVSKELMRIALTPQVDLDPKEALGFSGQGLGFFLLESDRGPVFTHPGFNMPGATCMLLAFPETGQGAVIMTNGARGLELSIEILDALANAHDWPAIH